MNSEILVSVCLPTYNSEDYISKTLQSIIDQRTNFKFEIIISDDASTDKTVGKVKSILRKSNFKNFKILESEKNYGINSNLRKAFASCIGEYIAILDADDLWIDSRKLQRQFELLNSNEDIEYTYTNYIYCNICGKMGENGLPENFKHPSDNQFEKQLLAPYICICTIFLKRAILDFELLDEFIKNRFISQDYPLLLEISKKYKGLYENRTTTQVNLKPDSISRPNTIDKKLLYFQNCYDIGSFFIRKYGINRHIQNKRDFHFHLKMILLLWKTKDFPRIKDYARHLELINFIRYQPKSIYIYFASKNRLFYDAIKRWTLRKRTPGN